jgi:hypothetical protein
MTDTATTPVLGLDLPGQWRRIPLDDRDAAHAAIGNLIRRRVGPGIRNSSTRDEIRSELRSLVDSVPETDGVRMYVAMSLFDALPLSAALTIRTPQFDISADLVEDPSTLLRVVEERLRQLDPDGWETATRFQIRDALVLRAHRQRLVPGASPQVLRAALSVDYWMSVPGSRRPFQLTFTTPFAEHDDAMLAEFDRIVRSIRWQH